MFLFPEEPIKRLAIVLTDFRLPMLLAIIQLHWQFPNSEIIVHANSSDLYDYGDYSAPWYKRLKLWIVQKICDVRFVVECAEIEKEDFIGLNSSLISITNDSTACEERYPQLSENLKKATRASIGVANMIFREEYDGVAIFNGRLTSVFPIMRRCNDAHLPALYYEYGEQPFHFTFSRFRPHDYQAKADAAIALYERPELNSTAIVTMQRAAANPEEKLRNRFSIKLTEPCETVYDFCLFLGSPHEFLSLLEGVQITNLRIVERISTSKRGLRGAVRAHPNQKNDPSWRDESASIEAICIANGFDYFPPDSEINSHSLIQNSDLTIVAGSSIAIDALLLGAKIEFVSNSLYSLLIEYTRSTNLKVSESVALAQLVSLTSNVWQLPYHPRFVILMRLMHFFDNRMSKTPFVGSQLTNNSNSRTTAKNGLI